MKLGIIAIITLVIALIFIFLATKLSASGTGGSGSGSGGTGPEDGGGSTDSSAPSSVPSVGTSGVLGDLFGMNANLDEVLANISADDSTWIDGYSSGDRIWVIATAIAHAEGANKPGSVPDRLNNPGDITDGRSTYGVGFTDSQDGSQLTHFPDKATGWKFLYDKIRRITENRSGMGVDSNSTWTQIAQKWATNWEPWVNIVCSNLNTNPEKTIGDYMNGRDGYWPS